MVLALVAVVCAPAKHASAAYSADVTVDLSSPDINLTILSGSTEPTSLVVNTGTVVVTVPASGTFTISSADRMLQATGESGFGVITTTCSSSLVSTMVITATSGSSEAITVTPASLQCTTGTTGGGGGGGGGGTTTPPAATTTTTTTTNTNTTTTTATTYDLGTTTLKNGSKGPAVMDLQKLLNKVLNLGLAVDGKLGPKTIAVIKTWQKAHGLKADGLIGAKTKAMLKASAQ